MRTKKIFITGSEGFIAHYLINKLNNKRYKVFGSYFRRKVERKNIRFFKCDVRDYKKVKSLINKVKPDIIFHLAAKSHPIFSFKNPVETIETNVMGTINILEACRSLELKPKIIIACSSAQYGVRKISNLPMIETDKYAPEHIYGLSKVFQENLGYQYFKMFNLRIVNAIIFNTSGPRKKFDVFFDICKQFAKQIKNKKIYIKCGNLSNFRDFMHVEDVANGLIVLSKKGVPGHSYNIGSSKLTKVSEIIILLEKIYKKKIILKVEKKLLREFDEKYISSSNKKLKKLGWKLKKTTKDIIIDMIDFVRKN